MSLMKTGPGKKIAEHRHAFMQSFLRQLDSEYAFAGQQSWSHEVIGIRSLEEP